MCCFHIGTVKLMVIQPRLPCYKPGIRFGRPDIIKRFLASRRTGFYFRVLQEGEVGAGDTLELVSRDDNNITVANITQLYTREHVRFREIQKIKFPNVAFAARGEST
ncbi:MOSC domain-containing protein [Nostoc sp. NMS9]|uniref:MOSC domain-containing protein n=1 Tax=Nostoc sp. NMS9 TaxID=2815393 RepID=UPI003458EC39